MRQVDGEGIAAQPARGGIVAGAEVQDIIARMRQFVDEVYLPDTLAIAGFYKDLPGTFHQQRLLSEDFVVLAAHDNPRLADGLDLQSFVTCEHLITTLTGDLEGLVDRALQQRGLHQQSRQGRRLRHAQREGETMQQQGVCQQSCQGRRLHHARRED